MINVGAFLYAARQSINCDRPNCKDESITRYSVVYYIEQCCRNTPQNCSRIWHVTQHNSIHRSQATCIHCWQVTLHNLYASYTTCMPGDTTQPVRQVALHNLYVRSHYTPLHQVTLHNLYARSLTRQPVRQVPLQCIPGHIPKTCTLGATTAHVHRVALNSLYTRRYYTAVCQVTLHNLYARSHYTICTLDNIIHNLSARSHYTNTRHSFMLYNIAHSGTSG